jgi:hypothetical protein
MSTLNSLAEFGAKAKGESTPTWWRSPRRSSHADRALSSPASFRDRYQDALRELVEAKTKGMTMTAPRAVTEPPKVINLMDGYEAQPRAARGAGAEEGSGKQTHTREVRSRHASTGGDLVVAGRQRQRLRSRRPQLRQSCGRKSDKTAAHV